MIKEIFEVSRVARPRHRYEVLSKLMEEVGELAQEIGIEEGYQNRPPGKDGVIGECADVINTVVDIAFLTKPDLTDEEFLDIIKVKLAKWRSYAEKFNP